MRRPQAIYANYTKQLLHQILQKKKSRMDQSTFMEDSIKKIRSDMVSLIIPYHFKFFKGCLPQILLPWRLTVEWRLNVTFSLLTTGSPLISLNPSFHKHSQSRRISLRWTYNTFLQRRNASIYTPFRHKI